MSESTLNKPIMESELSTSLTDDISSSTPDIDESKLEFNRKNIESLNKYIRLVDSNEETGLDLFCYIHCESTDSDIRKQCRGVVFHHDELVMKGFPYTMEYTEQDNLDEINNNIVSIFDNCSFYDAYEGSLIRMFFFKDKWYLSTNRKLDAFKSKWASKESFGSFFKKALEIEFENNERLRNAIPFDISKDDVIERFQSILDKDKQYMFLLMNNNENRIVCSAPEKPTVYHVGTFVDYKLSMEEDIYLNYPRKHNFENIEQLLAYVRNDSDYTKIQGVIIFTSENKQYKIFNQEYADYYKVRGNEPSIKYRYLQIRNIKKFNETMHYLYPEYKDAFAEYENHIYEIAASITQSYVERFIRKNYVTVPVEEFQVIRLCHAWHLENRLENKISINKVLDVLNQQSPTNINRMIRKKIAEKNGIIRPTFDKNPLPQFLDHVSLLRRKTKELITEKIE